MEFTKSLIKGKLIKRYKRFFTDVKLGKEIVTAHCPNTGSMKGLLDEGNDVYVLPNNDPKRKGFEFEPWHYSYKSSSKKYLKALINSDLEKIFKNKNLNGYEYFDKNFIDKYILENIMDINPDLK